MSNILKWLFGKKHTHNFSSEITYISGFPFKKCIYPNCNVFDIVENKDISEKDRIVHQIEIAQDRIRLCTELDLTEPLDTWLELLSYYENKLEKYAN